MPSSVHTHPNETVRDAIDILREYGVSQLPVVKAEPPVMAAEVVGSVTERTLLDALFNGDASLADSVERHMSPSLPIVARRADRRGARRAEGRRALVVARRRPADRRPHAPGPPRAPRSVVDSVGP